MQNKNILTALLASTFTAGSLQAQLVTDRPDQTESASVVPQKALQLETGILIGYNGIEKPTERRFLVPTNLFRYGISHSVELRFVGQFEVLKRSSAQMEGISDLEIGTKIQLLRNENSNTDIAFLTHLIIPLGTESLSNNHFGTVTKVSVSHILDETFGLGYNVGYDYFGEGKGDLTYSLSLGIGLTDRMGIYVEPYGELTNLEKYVLNFDTGFTYLATNQLQFDVSLGTGINQNMAYFAFGCSWLIQKSN